MILVGGFMEPDVMGQTLLANQRLARLVGLGDRSQPAAYSPCLVIDESSVGKVPSHLAPFIHKQDNSELPGTLSFHSRLPLAIPFENIGPTWSTRLGHVLPPSMEDADNSEHGDTGPLLAVSWQRLRHDPELLSDDLKPQVVVLLDALQLAGRPGKLAKALFVLRKRFSSALLWCPAISGPDNLALLTWMGVDIHDLARTSQCEANRVLLTSSGPRHCEVTLGEEVSRERHIEIWTQEMATVRRAIRDGTLRELVEQRVISSPRMVEHLRYHDALVNENKTPSTLSVVVPPSRALRAHSSTTLNDAEVLDWVNFMNTEYSPPSGFDKVLILLPCSERKPYRDSRSHHRFREAIGNTSAHEVMVTSPLGLVPRDLERIWPAAHYDVPTTGDWTADEINRITAMVSTLVQNNRYELVINHSSIELESFVQVPLINTRGNASATSKEALSRLSEAVSSAREEHGIEGLAKNHRLFLEFRSIARRQMRNDAWMEGIRVGGKPPRWKVYDGQIQMAQWLPDRGSLSLTKAALPRLMEHDSLPRIHLKEGSLWKGDVFTSNLQNFDSDFKEGGDLLVMQDGKLIGMARATIAPWAWPDSPGRLAKGHHRL